MGGGYRETRGYLSGEEERRELDGGGDHGGPPLVERNGGGERRMVNGDGTRGSMLRSSVEFPARDFSKFVFS